MARFPLQKAYPFAEEHGLSDFVPLIKGLPGAISRWEIHTRRAYMIDLFKERGIYSKFCKKYWQEDPSEIRTSQNARRNYKNYWAKKSQSRVLEQLQTLESKLKPEQSEAYEESDTSQDPFVDTSQDPFVDTSQDPFVDTSQDPFADTSQNAFAYEKDLQSFVADNLDIVENGLTLYADERGSGREYPVEKGRIDLLAKDRDGRFVVIELKASQGRRKDISQLLYYMGWIDENLGSTQPCRGILIAREIPSRVITASKRTDGIELFEYSLQVSLKKAGTDRP